MPNPILVSMKIVDYTLATGGEKSVNLFLPDNMTLADATTAAQAAATAIDSGIDGYISEISVTLPIARPGPLRDAPNAGNTVHEGALFTLANEENNTKQLIYVPSWSNTNFAGNTVITSAGTPGLACKETFENSSTPAYGFTNSQDIALSALVAAKRAFRK